MKVPSRSAHCQAEISLFPNMPNFHAAFREAVICRDGSSPGLSGRLIDCRESPFARYFAFIDTPQRIRVKIC